MAPKSLSLLTVISSLLLAFASVEASFGGWQAINNLTDPKVVEIAEFAVKQHNMRVNAMLRLVAVVNGETQMVDGVNYRLDISAANTLMSMKGNYRVVVWDKPWNKERKLISFDKTA
ncbi:cysteine protein inhibitor 5 [Dorcoceras hygrometricum]|uniref:Cysteine protein inhibitor 5 n=1 Tax=Dorcoceras hygrometricum TaxID=472368 RepID=A0A2Z7DCL0_9LAMI|nr:cysteine protein inhibitor 5 [Dorcoceras hygrometricum]